MSDKGGKQAEAAMVFYELASEATHSHFSNSLVGPQVSPIGYERRPHKGVTTKSWGFSGATSLGSSRQDKRPSLQTLRKANTQTPKWTLPSVSMRLSRVG